VSFGYLTVRSRVIARPGSEVHLSVASSAAGTPCASEPVGVNSASATPKMAVEMIGPTAATATSVTRLHIPVGDRTNRGIGLTSQLIHS
jgi:hypothetical protein